MALAAARVVLALAERTGARTVLLSGSNDASLPGHARALELMAFLSTTLAPAEIASEIALVLAGEVRYPAEDSEPDTPRRTPSQAGVLQAVASGQANNYIARRLGVSESTVKFHLEQAFARLAMSRRVDEARGLALGLAIVQRMVRLLSHGLGLPSRAGFGSRV